MSKNLFIDPTNLSTPSSPSGSSCTYDDTDATRSVGPARKRVRTQDVTSEERKEARAHRNRIAAQNSRDRRKAHFVYLERRVVELEEENRRLRSGAGILPAEVTSVHQEDRMGDDHDRARNRENEELKERIRTLERGWDVVMKALAAQNLPNLAPAPAPQSTSTTDVELNTTKPPSVTSGPCIPIPNSTEIASFPSPTLSHSSLESESPPTTLPGSMLSDNAPSRTGSKDDSKQVSQTTRHLAAGGLTVCAAMSTDFLSSVHSGTPSQTDSKLSIPNVAFQDSECEDDDTVMEALFREIVTSTCTTQDATNETFKVSIAGSGSAAEVMVDGETASKWQFLEMGDTETQQRAREGKTLKDHTSFVDEDTEFRDYSEEWTTEIETERMLDEMIAMTGLVGGETTFPAEYPEIGLGLGVDLDLNLGISTLSSWDMDAVVDCIGAH